MSDGIVIPKVNIVKRRKKLPKKQNVSSQKNSIRILLIINEIVLAISIICVISFIIYLIVKSRSSKRKGKIEGIYELDFQNERKVNLTNISQQSIIKESQPMTIIQNKKNVTQTKQTIPKTFQPQTIVQPQTIIQPQVQPQTIVKPQSNIQSQNSRQFQQPNISRQPIQRQPSTQPRQEELQSSTFTQPIEIQQPIQIQIVQSIQNQLSRQNNQVTENQPIELPDEQDSDEYDEYISINLSNNSTSGPEIVTGSINEGELEQQEGAEETDSLEEIIIEEDGTRTEVEEQVRYQAENQVGIENEDVVESQAESESEAESEREAENEEDDESVGDDEMNIEGPRPMAPTKPMLSYKNAATRGTLKGGRGAAPTLLNLLPKKKKVNENRKTKGIKKGASRRK